MLFFFVFDTLFQKKTLHLFNLSSLLPRLLLHRRAAALLDARHPAVPGLRRGVVPEARLALELLEVADAPPDVPAADGFLGVGAGLQPRAEVDPCAALVLLAGVHALPEIKVGVALEQVALEVLEDRGPHGDRGDDGHRNGDDFRGRARGAAAVEAEDEAAVGPVVDRRRELVLVELAGLEGSVGPSLRPVVGADPVAAEVAVLVVLAAARLRADLGAGVAVGDVLNLFQEVGLAVAAPFDLLIFFLSGGRKGERE